MLDPGIEVLDVFPDDDQIDAGIGEARGHAGQGSAGRILPYSSNSLRRVTLALLPPWLIGVSSAFRTTPASAIASIVSGRHARGDAAGIDLGTGLVLAPVDERIGGVDHPPGGGHDLRADAVAGNGHHRRLVSGDGAVQITGVQDRVGKAGAGAFGHEHVELHGPYSAAMVGTDVAGASADSRLDSDWPDGRDWPRAFAGLGHAGLA